MNIYSVYYRRAIQEAKWQGGVRRVSLQEGARTISRVQLDDDGYPIVALATCAYCGRTWNDALITAVTPVPSARCPFEYEHRRPATRWPECDLCGTRAVDCIGGESYYCQTHLDAWNKS